MAKKPFDEDDVTLYFGREEEQKAVITALEGSIDAGEKKLHLVSGEGSSVGKSNAILAIREKMESDDRYEALDSRTISGKVPGELASIIADASGNYAEHVHIYKDKERPYYVVINDPHLNEMAPAHPKSLELLKRIAAFIKSSDRNAELCWVADAPILGQNPPILNPRAFGVKSKKDHEKALSAMEKEFEGIVEGHFLTYDLSMVRKSLRSQASQHGGPAFVDHLEKSRGFGENSAEWKRLAKAMEKEDWVEFDAAFDVLAKRAEQHRNPG